MKTKIIFLSCLMYGVLGLSAQEIENDMLLKGNHFRLESSLGMVPLQVTPGPDYTMLEHGIYFQNYSLGYDVRLSENTYLNTEFGVGIYKGKFHFEGGYANQLEPIFSHLFESEQQVFLGLGIGKDFQVSDVAYINLESRYRLGFSPAFGNFNFISPPSTSLATSNGGYGYISGISLFPHEVVNSRLGFGLGLKRIVRGIDLVTIKLDYDYSINTPFQGRYLIHEDFAGDFEARRGHVRLGLAYTFSRIKKRSLNQDDPSLNTDLLAYQKHKPGSFMVGVNGGLMHDKYVQNEQKFLNPSRTMVTWAIGLEGQYQMNAEFYAEAQFNMAQIWQMSFKGSSSSFDFVKQAGLGFGYRFSNKEGKEIFNLSAGLSGAFLPKYGYEYYQTHGIGNSHTMAQYPNGDTLWYTEKRQVDWYTFGMFFKVGKDIQLTPNFFLSFSYQYTLNTSPLYESYSVYDPGDGTLEEVTHRRDMDMNFYRVGVKFRMKNK